MIGRGANAWKGSILRTPSANEGYRNGGAFDRRLYKICTKRQNFWRGYVGICHVRTTFKRESVCFNPQRNIHDAALSAYKTSCSGRVSIQ